MTTGLSPYAPIPRWQRGVRAAAIVVSVGIHLVLGTAFVAMPAPVDERTDWVEVLVSPPPPPPVAPPPPEPPKPKPPPKPIKFEDIRPPEPTPTTAPEQPTPPPARRVVSMSRLSANSVAVGGDPSLRVATGETASVGAGNGAPEGDGGGSSRPYGVVAVPPRLKWEPPALDVPEEARKAQVAGTIEVLLDVDASGAVSRARILKDLGFGTGEACAAEWRRSKWKPGEQDGQPVAVTGIRKTCTIRIE